MESSNLNGPFSHCGVEVEGLVTCCLSLASLSRLCLSVPLASVPQQEVQAVHLQSVSRGGSQHFLSLRPDTTLSLSHTHTLSVTHTLSLAHTHTHTLHLSLLLTFSLEQVMPTSAHISWVEVASLSLPLTHTLWIWPLSLSLTHTHTLSNSLVFSLTLLKR